MPDLAQESFARMRRLRRSETLRRLVRETRLSPDALVAPVFVMDGSDVEEPIEGMPGVGRYSVDRLLPHVGRLRDAGVRAILLFGIPASKDEVGTLAYSPRGVVPRAIRELRKQAVDIVIAADVCLCEYTTHGHCGVLDGETVDNDRTVLLLARAATEYARAGADVVAPSAMMDGQVRAVRLALEEEKLTETVVMGYSAKYASSFYAPFRNAAQSAPTFGDRRAYQMDPPNSREALREIRSDIEEGADIVMVKPALEYLDVIAKARAKFDVPMAAYNVSGEYAMVKAASSAGWLDERAAAMEQLLAIRRAGADLIITYFAEAAAGWLAEGR